MTDTTIKKQDGRRLRSAASRLRIVEAMRDLIREGNVSPRAEEVATRANVGLRTVFRHFDDMESLYREIGALAMVEAEPLLDLTEPSGTAEERFLTMLERRSRLFERIMPFRIAADANAHRSPYLVEDRDRMNAGLRDLLRNALPASLRKDRTLVDALDAVLSFDMWRRLRMDQNLSVPQAKRTIEAMGLALLAPVRNKR
ncbi:TetR/AcrR family transcriptional regulator [Parvibaculum sp.]|jgi:AcrR family transcriptional regulator|uniref:TetR/AcrR family transcriptional regulator n=1 Tax=Parvibaculum sp. TaxID=2024848 RepID=UPI00391A38E7